MLTFNYYSFNDANDFHITTIYIITLYKGHRRNRGILTQQVKQQLKDSKYKLYYYYHNILYL